MRHHRHLAIAATAILLTTSPGAAGPLPPDPPTDVELAAISGDPERPRRHFRVRNWAEITPEEATKIYAGMVREMQSGYRLSGHPAAMAYRGWRRYNTRPYLSATHGRRYVNNYANTKARAYGDYEAMGRLPEGAIVAKDSFAVTVDGVVNAGPFFVMEKMPAGFNYVSGDWRYTMIMPDGSVYGATRGVNAERVEYCIACHLAREDTDHLFFPPPDTRR